MNTGSALWVSRERRGKQQSIRRIVTLRTRATPLVTHMRAMVVIQWTDGFMA